jgi:hypothetical protein
MNLTETGYEDGRWMELAQDRVHWHYYTWDRCAYRVFGRKNLRDLSAGKNFVHRWKDNIKMILREMGCGFGL